MMSYLRLQLHKTSTTLVMLKNKLALGKRNSWFSQLASRPMYQEFMNAIAIRGVVVLALGMVLSSFYLLHSRNIEAAHSPFRRNTNRPPANPSGMSHVKNLYVMFL
jgi:preprotein translocase subunit Sss1